MVAVVTHTDIPWEQVQIICNDLALHKHKQHYWKRVEYHKAYGAVPEHKERSRFIHNLPRHKAIKKISRHAFYLRNRQMEIDRAAAWNKEHKEQRNARSRAARAAKKLAANTAQ